MGFPPSAPISFGKKVEEFRRKAEILLAEISGFPAKLFWKLHTFSVKFEIAKSRYNTGAIDHEEPTSPA